VRRGRAPRPALPGVPPTPGARSLAESMNTSRPQNSSPLLAIAAAAQSTAANCTCAKPLERLVS